MSKLHCSIIGGMNEGVRDEDNPNLYLSEPLVQEALLELAHEPLDSEQLHAKYSQVEAEIANLLRVGAIREEEGRIYLNFTLLTHRDHEILFSIGREYGELLAEQVASKSGQIRELMSSCSRTAASPEQLAFIAVGFCILDITALRRLSDWGYMLFQKEQTGGSFTVFATEKVELDLSGVYYGGHMDEAGPYRLVSFGDHARLPRRLLPDVLWQAFRPGPKVDSQQTRDLVGAYRQQLKGDIASVIPTLLPGAEGPDCLSSEPLMQTIVEWLDWLGYLSDATLSVPYFSAADGPALSELQAILVPELRAWCQQYYESIKKATGEATPLRHGVPYPEVFGHMWHYVFGLANKRLADMGLIFDAYAPDHRSPGCVPAILEEGSCDLNL